MGSKNVARIGEGLSGRCSVEEGGISKEAIELSYNKRRTVKPLLQPSQDCVHITSYFHSPGSPVIPTKLSWPQAVQKLHSLPCCISAKPHTFLLLQQV